MNTGDVLQNRYRIARLVGQGGFGAVYRAWDGNLRVPVALKENTDVGLDAQRQFEREALLLANLRHPNLPRVSDHFVLPGQGQYLVMDFVEGKSLADLLRERGGPLGEAEVLPWIDQVCDALNYLHSRPLPVIHRDIKPHNVIITPDGRAMLVDFGISKVDESGHNTTAGARAVTPGYSPPEQYGTARTDARSDIYALGATLYTLLTNREPPESVLLVIGQAALTPVAQINPAVSFGVEQAIGQAMELDANRRLQNAAALRRALTSSLPARAGMAAQASGRFAVAPLAPPPRRDNRLWWGVAVLALVFLVLLALWLARGFGAASLVGPLGV